MIPLTPMTTADDGGFDHQFLVTSCSSVDVIQPQQLSSRRSSKTFEAEAARHTVVIPANRKKRVSFAEDDTSSSLTSRTVLSSSSCCRGPTSKRRRRRRCSLWCDTAADQLSAPSTRSSDPLSMPLQSINCNIGDVTESRVVMTSSHSIEQQRALSLSTALPADPRLWTRSDVHAWLLQHTMTSAALSPSSSSVINSQPHHHHPHQHHHHQQQQQPFIEVDVDRFRMNGKALCLMTVDMFAYRVPRGGHLLYKDFQARLCRAVAVSLHRGLINAAGGSSSSSSSSAAALSLAPPSSSSLIVEQ